MTRINRRAVKAALVAALAAVTLTVAPQSASAINTVECNDNSEFLLVDWHNDYGGGWSDYHFCFANAGEWSFERPGTQWVDKIWTGNNRVQWYGDGRWQPATPIDKWTTFNWPNHPGGVRIEKIRIL
ncbi:beta/gamma crystallin domain-containing protein [Streptomyces pactum]|uniref:beta/gamma crystallin domain-containing protein n=1 Tax=Streptomyces pactum TaxID=68249 RepID=UPI0027DC27D8|nr:beta/gamma crystallin domain-containing protein [Streptomyces pactum]